MIPIATNDSKICYVRKTWTDLLSAFISHPQFINISMIGEGPCLKTVGLYDILDVLCEKFSYSKQRVTIHTANTLECHSEYRIVKQYNQYELEEVKKIDGVEYQKIFDGSFKHFGHFIGHSNQYRLQMASYLWNYFRDQTLQTFHCKMTDNYHREFLGIEELMFLGLPHDELRDAFELILNAPLTIDPINQYPILSPANLNITKVYPNFFVEIVNLTYFSGDIFYVDEKIWRPIMMRTPFIVQGPANTIKNLRKLGFRTFDQWWDEGYSEDLELAQTTGIKQNIAALSKLGVVQIQKILIEMQPVLDHNYRTLMSLTSKDFAVIK